MAGYTPAASGGNYVGGGTGSSFPSSSAGGATALSLTTAEAGLSVPADQGQNDGGTVSQLLSQFLSADVTSQQQYANALWNSGLFSDTVYKSKSVTPTDIEAAMKKALLLAATEKLPLSQVLVKQSQQFQSSGGFSQFPGAQLRTLGLGRYPVVYTNPADIQQAADQIAISLVGRRATDAEKASIVSIVQGQEKTKAQTEFQSYLDQQMAYYESINGGIGGTNNTAMTVSPNAPASAAPSPMTQQGQGFPQAPPPNALPAPTGQGTGEQMTAGKPKGKKVEGGKRPASMVETPTSYAAGPSGQAIQTTQQQQQQQQANQNVQSILSGTGFATAGLTAAPGLAPAPVTGSAAVTGGTQPALPPGSVVTANGTVLLAPQEAQVTDAASPGAAMYQNLMTNDRPEVNGYLIAQILSKFADTLGKAGG